MAVWRRQAPSGVTLYSGRAIVTHHVVDPPRLELLQLSVRQMIGVCMGRGGRHSDAFPPGRFNCVPTSPCRQAQA